MNHITYRISLDLRQTDSGVVVRVKRDDTLKKLAISFTDGGKPYDITADCEPVFAGEKPDGTIVCNDCGIEGGVVTYKITSETVAALGEVKSEIRLFNLGGELATSPSFTILVVPPVYDDDRVIESHDEVNELTKLITDAVSTIQRSGELNERAEEFLDGNSTEYVAFKPQTHTEEEKAQARENIGAAASGEAVLYKEQALTDAQKFQARSNIGAAGKTQADYNSARLLNGSLVLEDQRTSDKHILYSETGKLKMQSENTSVTFLTNEDEGRFVEQFAPGGYGWGEAKAAAMPDGDANNALETGLYRAGKAVNTPDDCVLVFTQAVSTGCVYQTAYCADGKMAMRIFDHDFWSEWNYLNSTQGQGEAILYTQQNLTDAQKAQARDNIGAVGGADVVKTTAQVLTHQQMDTARYNIDAAGTGQVVRIDQPQNLSEEQKTQARENIGAADVSLDNLGDNILSDATVNAGAGCTLVSNVNGVFTVLNDTGKYSFVGVNFTSVKPHTQKKGDIWYMGARVSCEEYTFGGKPTFPSIQLYATSEGEMKYAHGQIATTGSATDYFGTFTIDIDSPNGLGSITARAQYFTLENAAGKTCSFSDFVLVNLTEAYGAGNEPTADEYYDLLIGVAHNLTVNEKTLFLGQGGTGGTGRPGKDGITPEFSIGEVETLPAGSEATASITGTKENPVLNLGIPKGEDGKDGEGGGGEKWELLESYELPEGSEEVAGGVEIVFPEDYNEYLLIAELQATAENANLSVYPRMLGQLPDGTTVALDWGFWDYYPGVASCQLSLLFERKEAGGIKHFRMSGSYANNKPFGKPSDSYKDSGWLHHYGVRELVKWTGVKLSRRISALSNYVLLGRK